MDLYHPGCNICSSPALFLLFAFKKRKKAIGHNRVGKDWHIPATRPEHRAASNLDRNKKKGKISLVMQLMGINKTYHKMQPDTLHTMDSRAFQIESLYNLGIKVATSAKCLE
jgi:hypothetical protein